MIKKRHPTTSEQHEEHPRAPSRSLLKSCQVSPGPPPGKKSQSDCPREEDYRWFGRVGLPARHISTGDLTVSQDGQRLRVTVSMSNVGWLLIPTRRGVGGFVGWPKGQIKTTAPVLSFLC